MIILNKHKKMQFDWMIYIAETNVLTSYVCSLQVYIKEFGMHMHRLFGVLSTQKQNKEACLFFEKELLLYLLCSFSILNNIKTFKKFSIQWYATPSKPIFGPIDPFMYILLVLHTQWSLCTVSNNGSFWICCAPVIILQ